MTTAASPRTDMDTWAEPIKPGEVLIAAESMVQRLVAQHTATLDAAYRERRRARSRRTSSDASSWPATLHAAPN
ncbi:hypothetical protein [Streptomyces carpinensis]|uniref:Uncharacterized protein n=1 Tax=Streptomyces carpinensis TaxID=66369 RepID=A0ABV1WJT8_9ACTN|nr:hypothetical protein [Streptomyces carpinensis]